MKNNICCTLNLTKEQTHYLRTALSTYEIIYDFTTSGRLICESILAQIKQPNRKITNAYVIKNQKGQYLSNDYVYNWADNFDDEAGVCIMPNETFAKDTLKRVQKYLKDGKLVKVKIVEE